MHDAASEKRRNRVLLLMSMSTAVVTLDTSIVGLALPSIAHSLHAGFTDLEWVISGYVICFASLLLPAGTFADHVGRRLGVVSGLVLFGMASLWCGLAGSVGALIAGRVLQGVGGALLPSSSLAVIGHSFGGAERKRAFGVWGSALGIAITAGPVAGGVLTSLLGWRSIFLLNVPICLALMGLTFLWVDESRNPEARRYDLPGAATYTVGLVLLTSALIDLGGRRIWIRVAAAIVALCGFLLLESRTREPMLDLQLFRKRDFLGACTAMAGYASAGQVLVFYLPLFLQAGFGFSPLLAGFAMLPFALPMFAAPRFGVSLLHRFSAREGLTFALCVTAVGDGVLAVSGAVHSFGLAAFAMFLSGSGAGLLNGETARVFQETMSRERSGTASGLAAGLRFTTLLLAVAVLGAVLTPAAHRSMHAFIPSLPEIPGLLKKLAAGDVTRAAAMIPERLRGVFSSRSGEIFAKAFA